MTFDNFTDGTSAEMRFSSIDIFCCVVDNFGDAGVVYRFAKEFLLAHPYCRIRVFCDDLKPLASMRPGIDPAMGIQECGGIVYADSAKLDAFVVKNFEPADVVIEAFGCDIPDSYDRLLLPRANAWINLEYLSAEPWTTGYHMQQSMLGKEGPKKYFYMPGFTEDTGGVIIDSDLENVKHALAERRLEHLDDFLRPFGLAVENGADTLVGTVFTYERAFDALLRGIIPACNRAYLFVCGEKSQRGMMATVERMNGKTEGKGCYRVGTTTLVFIPFLPQQRFDRLLCLSDFNLVRGEDSLVRAILAEKPLVWNAYLQDERYQLVKVDAVCRIMEHYFPEKNVFEKYRKTMMDFNDYDKEKPMAGGREDFSGFFNDLEIIRQATAKMSYFMTRKCDLVKKFAKFLSDI